MRASMAFRAGARNGAQRATTRSRTGLLRRCLLLALVLPTLLVGLPAFGSADDVDEYDPKASGHPLRIVAYALHPVGVILDTLIFRPAHWLGTKEPIKTLVGNTD